MSSCYGEEKKDKKDEKKPGQMDEPKEKQEGRERASNASPCQTPRVQRERSTILGRRPFLFGERRIDPFPSTMLP